METLTSVYERLDALDASTAKVRVRTILKGLAFIHDIQAKKTKDFSGGWRGASDKMQVQKTAELSDSRCSCAVFAKPGRDVPHILLLDESTNHLGV